MKVDKNIINTHATASASDLQNDQHGRHKEAHYPQNGVSHNVPGVSIWIHVIFIVYINFYLVN